MKIIAFILLIFSFDKMSSQEVIRPDTNKKTTDCGPGPNKFSGKLDGPHKTYNKNRQISKDGIFKDNMLWDGKSFIYDKDGKLERIHFYKKGQLTQDSAISLIKK